jgi:hypothetical protein
MKTNGLNLFFRLNKWAFVYLISGPLVGFGVAFLVSRFGYVRLVFDLDVLLCTVYAWFFSFESFRNYKKRKSDYLRLRQLYLTHGEVKKSYLWSLKKIPCGDLVVAELEKEFGTLLD